MLTRKYRNRLIFNSIGAKQPKNVLRADPTRTATLRRSFETEMVRRFVKFRRELVSLIVDEDAFGLKEANKPWSPVINSQFSSTQINVTDPECLRRIRELQGRLNPTDVIELETEPHVTVRYGLHGQDPEAVREIVANVFCKTGEGGGVDATCSPKKSIQSVDNWRESGGKGVTASGRIHRPKYSIGQHESVYRIRLTSEQANALGNAVSEKFGISRHEISVEDIKIHGGKAGGSIDKNKITLSPGTSNQIHVLAHEMAHGALGFAEDMQIEGDYGIAQGHGKYHSSLNSEIYDWLVDTGLKKVGVERYSGPMKYGDRAEKATTTGSRTKRVTTNSFGPVWMTLGRLSLFQQPEHDVLKLDVESQGLERLNTELGKLPNVQTHDNYEPHLTIAYLKPGTGWKYLADPSFLEWQSYVFTEMTFSDSERRQTELALNVFCKTGEGGGVDPSCSSEKGNFVKSARGQEHESEATSKFLESLGDAPSLQEKEIADAVTRKFLNVISIEKTGKLIAAVAFSDTGNGSIDIKHIGSVEKGGGSALIKRLQETYSYITTSHTRESAHGFYRKTGFEIGESGDAVWKSPLIQNVFCPTGEGGGVDPSCSPGNREWTPKSSLTEFQSGMFRSVLGGYSAIHAHIRGERKLDISDEEFSSFLSELDKNFSPLDKPMTLYRGVKHSDKILAGAKVGDVIQPDGYSSTSRDKKVAIQFATKLNRGETPAVFEITAPVGTMAITDVVRITGEVAGLGRPEKEVLLKRGTKFRIVSIKPGKVKLEIIPDSPTTNTRWSFRSSPEKIKAFLQWLQGSLRPILTDEATTDDDWWTKYVMAGFKKGAARSYDDMKKAGAIPQSNLPFYLGQKDEFLKSAFRQPESVEKVKLLAGRVYTELKGVTEAMSQNLTRTLTDGLTQGMNPRQIATNIVRDVEGIGIRRARAIAQIEIIRAHAEGQLDSMERLGVKELRVMVEWGTAEDDRVCKLCQPLHGIVITMSEAKGMIPRHVGCRCTWLPANVGEDPAEQIRGASRIKKAITKSLVAGKSKRKSTWAGAKRKISKSRPKSRV